MMTKTGGSTRKPSHVSAIILAAGRSTRMGRFKPLLPFGSSTVVETCIDTVRNAGIENVIVVLGHRAEEVKKQLADYDVVFTTNPNPGSEMSASVAYGVAHVPPDASAVIILPADYPAVPSRVITELMDEWKRGGMLQVPTWNNRGGHPVLVDLQYRHELLNLDPQRGLRALFDLHRDEVRRVPVNSNFIARDMDTWDDYRALHMDVFGVPPSEPRRQQN
jgi:CTP:molybdopterin cytidylyltransferase MocA